MPPRPEEPLRKAHRARYRKILRFAAWNLATTWFFEILLPRIGLSRVTERTRAARMQRFAGRFHTLAVHLGGLMIKVGQFLSSRLDVLPPEFTAELEGLQDEVPPVPFPAVRDLAERELGAALSARYAFFSETPIAAASLGQAHRARLLPADATDTGFSEVVVKIQRPGIADIVEADLAALTKVGGWLSHIRLVSQRADAPGLVREFAATSREEIDYLNEAANAEQFAADFADDSRVEVPAVAWERATRRVLTLADVTAIKITDTAGLRAAGISPADVAPVFAAVMFDQLFGSGFFHADPHPGNIFVTPCQPASSAEADSGPAWRLTFVDFGMMGHVPATTRTGLRKLLIAAAARDGKGLVAAINDLGVLIQGADTAELERAMTALFDRFGGMGFAELRDVDPQQFRDFAQEFGEVLRALPFQLPEDFLLIMRAISLISGVCSALDPQFNLWDSVEPYAQELLRVERGNLAADLGKQALDAVALVASLPRRIDEVLSRAEAGSLQVRSPQLERRVARLHSAARSVAAAVVFAALLIAGAVVFATNTAFGLVLMSVSVLPLLATLFTGRGRF